MTQGLFDVGLIDPPWSFATYSDKGKGKSPERHYPTMTIEDICALPIGDLFGPNGVLFLWVTWPILLTQAPRVIEAWGFEYKTSGFVWAKTNKKSDGFFMGTGYYTRANTEPCLLCIKKGGRAPVANRGVRELIVAPVTRHSEKPQEQYERIEALYPEGRKIEIFARARRVGWWALGNEVNAGMDIRDSLPRVLTGQPVPGFTEFESYSGLRAHINSNI